MTYQDAISDLNNTSDPEFIPTPSANDRAIHLLGMLCDMLGHSIPDIMPDGENGIIMEWGDRRDLVSVHLFANSARAPYLYLRNNNASSLSYDVSATNISIEIENLKERIRK